MKNNINSPFNHHQKDKDKPSQLETIFHYLSNKIATASMTAHDTGIKQKNICRYKKDLERLNRLWEVEKGVCKLTGRKAWYITTNTDFKRNDNQLKLFDD